MAQETKVVAVSQHMQMSLNTLNHYLADNWHIIGAMHLPGIGPIFPGVIYYTLTREID
jgi:hypothetical protein